MANYQIKAVYQNGSNIAEVHMIYPNGSHLQIAALRLPPCGDVKESSDLVEGVVRGFKKLLQIS
jgi:hypothetical protein